MGLKPSRTFWILATDGLLFAGLVAGYFIARVHAPQWPRPFHFPSGLMTIASLMFLGASSFVMRFAVASVRRGDDANAQRMLALAIVGLVTHLFLLGLEWARMVVGEDTTLLSNPWRLPLVGLSYFGLSGYQAVHALLAAVWLALAASEPKRWSLPSLQALVDFTTGMFVVIAFGLILSSADLNGF